MVWEWSHTPEAYANARANLERMPLGTLVTIEAEWRAHTDRETDPGAFSSAKYQRALRSIGRDIGRHGSDSVADSLADSIWDRMAEQRDCTNGGFEAHCCPYGCGCHLVPFDPPDE